MISFTYVEAIPVISIYCY